MLSKLKGENIKKGDFYHLKTEMPVDILVRE